MCGNFNAGPKRHVLLYTDGSQLVSTRRETRVAFGHKILSDAETMKGQYISRSSQQQYHRLLKLSVIYNMYCFKVNIFNY